MKKLTCSTCISYEPTFYKAWCNFHKKEVMANDPACKEWDTRDINIFKEALEELDKLEKEDD